MVRTLFLSFFRDTSLAILSSSYKKEDTFMEALTIIFTLAGAATLTRGIMRVVSYLDR